MRALRDEVCMLGLDNGGGPTSDTEGGGIGATEAVSEVRRGGAAHITTGI